MAQYYISGVWKNNQGVITHYAFHTVQQSGGITRAVKTSKTDAIAIVEVATNIVYTWTWDYNTGYWSKGEKVHIVNNQNSKYLRSNRDKQLTDNLNHLINFDWIAK